MAGNVIEISDSTFRQEVLDSSIPVLVDFWAPWCAPCRQLTPTIESLAAEFAGRVKVAKYNTDASQATALEYQVESIPTVILFKNGQVVDRAQGAHPKSRFVQMLSQV